MELVWSCISTTPVLLNPLYALERRLSKPQSCLRQCNEEKISTANWRWILILCSTSLYPSHCMDWSTQTTATYRRTWLWHRFKKRLVYNITYSVVPINSTQLNITSRTPVIMTCVYNETQNIQFLSWHHKQVRLCIGQLSVSWFRPKICWLTYLLLRLWPYTIFLRYTVGLLIDTLVNAKPPWQNTKTAKPTFLDFYGISGTEFEILSYYGQLVYIKSFHVITLNIVKERLTYNLLLFYVKRVFSFVAPVVFCLSLFIHAFHCLYVHRCFLLPLYFFLCCVSSRNCFTHTDTHTHTHNIYVYVYIYIYIFIYLRSMFSVYKTTKSKFLSVALLYINVCWNPHPFCSSAWMLC